MKHLILILSVVIPFLASPSTAQVHYVASLGSDATGVGSAESPWRSIAHALIATASYTQPEIRVASGDYNEVLEIVRPVRLEGHYDPVTWLRTDTAVSYLGNAVNIRSDHVTLRGFRVSPRYTLSASSSRLLTLADILFLGREALTPPSVSLNLRGCQDVLLEDITIRDFYMTPASFFNYPEYRGVSIEDCARVRIRRLECRTLIRIDQISGFGSPTIALRIANSTDIAMEHSRIANIRGFEGMSSTYLPGPDVWLYSSKGGMAVGIQINNSEDLMLRFVEVVGIHAGRGGNGGGGRPNGPLASGKDGGDAWGILITDCNYVTLDGLRVRSQTPGAPGVSLTGYYSEPGVGGGIRVAGGGGLRLQNSILNSIADIPNLTFVNSATPLVYHNTFRGGGTAGVFSGGAFINNVIVNMQSNGVTLGGAEAHHNLTFGNAGAAYVGGATPPASFTADPRFLTGSEFMLDANSPVINAGAWIPSVTSDCEGQRRPRGALPDLGAWEFPLLEADLNLDGVVDRRDLLIFMEAWQNETAFAP